MKKIINSVAAILCIFALIFTLCACGDVSQSGIRKIELMDISQDDFYVGVTSDDYKIELSGVKDAVINDIEFVVDDESLIEININKKFENTNYLYFNITGKKAGKASFIVQTTDGVVKTEPVEIEVQEDVISINFSEEELVFNDYPSEQTVYLDIKTNSYTSEPQKHLQYISDNEDVATISYDENSHLGGCTVKAVGEGETYICVQTESKSVKSEKLKVIVNKPTEPPTEKPTQPKKESYSYSGTVNNSSDYSDDSYYKTVTVYITPTGKKYHYSQACAGKNAILTTLDSASINYDPCKKCAQ